MLGGRYALHDLAPLGLGEVVQKAGSAPYGSLLEQLIVYQCLASRDFPLRRRAKWTYGV